MHTRYSPIRRSPASIATPVAARLACVKPAASVYPEPGSNSSLYNFFFTYLIRNTLCRAVPSILSLFLKVIDFVSCTSLLKNFFFCACFQFCQISLLEVFLFFFFSVVVWCLFFIKPLRLFRGAKLRSFFLILQIFFKLF